MFIQFLRYSTNCFTVHFVGCQSIKNFPKSFVLPSRNNIKRSFLTDYVGLPVTASKQNTVDLIESATFEYVGMTGNPTATLTQALTLESGNCPLAHCTVGLLNLVSTCVSPRDAKIYGSLQQAQKLLDTSGGGTRREQAFTSALEYAIKGQWRYAASALESHLATSPLDILALRLVYDFYILSGDSKNIRGCVARVLPSWSSGVPGYGFILGMYAFGLEEMGDYRKAEETALVAIDMSEEDIWAMHSLAHVYEMEGRSHEGCTLLRQYEKCWSEATLLKSHMAWHHALFYLDQGNYNAVLRIFEAYLFHTNALPGQVAIFPLTDAASLLWRLALCSAFPKGQEAYIFSFWKRVLDLFRPFIGQHLSCFNDIHIMMCLSFLSTMESDDKNVFFKECQDFLSSQETYISSYPNDTTPFHKVSNLNFPFSSPSPGQAYGTAPSNVWATRYLGLPACHAMLAFTQQDYKKVIDLLLPLRHHFFHMGSSHAQRDVLDWTLIEACIRENQDNLANVLLAERTQTRGTNAQAWVRYAVVLDRLGQPTAAENARLNAYQFGFGQFGQGAH